MTTRKLFQRFARGGGHLTPPPVPSSTSSTTNRVTPPLGRFLFFREAAAPGKQHPFPLLPKRVAILLRGSGADRIRCPPSRPPPPPPGPLPTASLPLAEPAHLMSIFLPAPWWMRETCPDSTRRLHPDLTAAAAATPPGGEATTTPCSRLPSPGPWARGGPCFALLRSRPEGPPVVSSSSRYR
ncbi:hypothetical protein PAHAL_5G273000 [Panicum hallii]|uniref:Uncharacterized protein n=1 Tax=Panicum hallii TaxID=206008 RepID=A0A2S3HUH8_9POAL|nr:hypothetical protein PAHAL_5G273000 [Panicum hallii]